MDKEALNKRLESIRGGPWNWIYAKTYYAQLIERLEKHGLTPDEIDDILSVACTSAIEDERWRK